jgi:putative transposase
MLWQRRLPHWVPDQAIVFVTWRLAGTAPLSLKDSDPGRKFLLEDRHLDRTRTGPQWLGNPKVADSFVEALLHGEHVLQEYELHAWMVMPNHVHIVMECRIPLSEIMRWLKTASSVRANRILGRTNQPFWRREYYDHWVRDSKQLVRVVRYVEQNPVTAGLVERPEDWGWSSAKRTGDKIAVVTPCRSWRRG